jgi:hypothetical protein
LFLAPTEHGCDWIHLRQLQPLAQVQDWREQRKLWQALLAKRVAPPEHRLHQKAGIAVLKSLLPETGTEIRGHTRSYAELLAASGYSNRSKDFEDLLHILDRELRLITPTDVEGSPCCRAGGAV